MMNVIWLIVGGSLGTLLRYGVFCLFSSYSVWFPWATIVINSSGSFTIGFLYGLFNCFTVSPVFKNAIFIGLLGAFTTFSAYSLECLQMFNEGRYKVGILYIVLINVFSLFAVWFGFTLFKCFFNFSK